MYDIYFIAPTMNLAKLIYYGLTNKEAPLNEILPDSSNSVLDSKVLGVLENAPDEIKGIVGNSGHGFYIRASFSPNDEVDFRRPFKTEIIDLR